MSRAHADGTPSETKQGKQKWSPDDANFISRNLMSWATTLAVMGSRRPITEEDLPGVPSCMKMDEIERRAIQLWNEELEKRGTDAKIYRVLWKLSRKTYLQGLFLLALSGIMNALVRPLLLMYSVRALDPSVATLEAAMGWAAALGLVLFIENWSKARGMMICSHVGVLRACAACMQLLTLKAVRMRAGSSNEGSEQTLIGADMVGSAEFAVFLPFAVLGVLSLVCGVIVLCVTTGATGLAGLAVMFLTLLVSGPFAKQAKMRQKAQKTAAERLLACTREVLDGVKVVKMMGWEEAYAKRLKTLRTFELKELTAYRMRIMSVVQLGRAAPPLGVLCTVAAYSAAHGGRLRADVIFPVLSVFQTLRLPFVMLPLVVNLIVLVNVSLHRMDKYLHLPEHPKPAPPAADAAEDKAILSFEDVGIAWPRQVDHEEEARKAAEVAKAEKNAKKVAEAKKVRSSHSRKAPTM